MFGVVETESAFPYCHVTFPTNCIDFGKTLSNAAIYHEHCSIYFTITTNISNKSKIFKEYDDDFTFTSQKVNYIQPHYIQQITMDIIQPQYKVHACRHQV